MAVHVNDVFMAGKPETLKRSKEKIKEKFNISESGKVNKLLGFYSDWVDDAKGMYAKMTTEKDVKTIVEGCENYRGSYLRVQKNPKAPGTTLSKSDLEDTDNMNKYRSFVGQSMWYTTELGPGVENAAREFEVHMSHPGTDHWEALGCLIGYIKGK